MNRVKELADAHPEMHAYWDKYIRYWRKCYEGNCGSMKYFGYCDTHYTMEMDIRLYRRELD